MVFTKKESQSGKIERGVPAKKRLTADGGGDSHEISLRRPLPGVLCNMIAAEIAGNHVALECDRHQHRILPGGGVG